MKKSITLLTVMLSLFGCDGNEDPKISSGSIVETAKAHAGEGATDCNFFPRYPSRLDQIECMTTSYRNGQNFYYQYEITSTPNEAQVGVIFSNEQAALFHWTFIYLIGEARELESFFGPEYNYIPADERVPYSPNYLQQQQCINPSLSPVYGDLALERFNCDYWQDL